MSAKVQVEKYYAALRRLVDRGEPINNDTVALEAGSGRGSIKRSRPAYSDLIKAIEAASAAQAERNATVDPLPALKEQLTSLGRRLDQALEREVCLLQEVYTLREELRQARSGRLTVIKRPAR